MRTFKDSSNTSWSINLTIGEVMRVKQVSEGRFNLFDPESKPLADSDRTLRSIVFVEQLDDWATMWELLWLLIEPQAAALPSPVTAAKFGECMPADRLVEANVALQREWQDFFLQLQRHGVAATLEKAIKYQEMAIAKLKAAASDQRLNEVDAKVEASMDQTLSNSFGSLQESLESILGPTPGGSSGG